MKKNVKLLSVMMAACMAAGTLTGCQGEAQPATEAAAEKSATGTETTAAGAGDVTEITYWYSWTGATQENNEELTAKFNETVGKEKGIHVTAEYQGTYEDLHQKLQAAYVAKESPEVTVMEIGSIRTFAENGVLEPLDSYIADSGVDMGDFYEGLLPNCYVGDTCYGMPYLRSTPIMYCNNTILNEAGWDYKDIKTWDDLKEAALAVKEKTGKYGISQYSYYWTLEAFMIEHGTSSLNEDETATNINTPEAKEIFTFYRDLIDQGAVYAHNNAESDKVKTDVQNQNAAIWFGSTGSLKDYMSIADELGFELGTGFIPKEVTYGTTTGGCCLIMASNVTDEEKAAAWEFVKFMTETEQAISSSIKTGYLPTRKSAGSSETMQEYFKEVPLAKVALDQLEYAVGRPTNPGYVEAMDVMDETMDAIYINGADIDTALAEAEAKINKLLNQ